MRVKALSQDSMFAPFVFDVHLPRPVLCMSGIWCAGWYVVSNEKENGMYLTVGAVSAEGHEGMNCVVAAHFVQAKGAV